MSTLKFDEFSGRIQDWFMSYVDADSSREISRHRAHCDIPGLRNQREINALFDAFKEEIQERVIDGNDTQLWLIAKRCGASNVAQLIKELVWLAVEDLAYGYQDILDDQKLIREEDLANERGHS